MAGVLGRRGFALESAAARVCREAGARVLLDVRVQDMDLARPDALDNRRLEVVADGLPLFQGAQLAVDTTAASVLRRDGAARRRVVSQDGADWMQLAAGKNESILSSRVTSVAPDLLSSLVKLQAVGLRRVLISSTSWPKLRPEESLGICVRELVRRGGRGPPFWRAVLRKLLVSRCWSAGEVWAPTASPHPPRR